MTLLLNIIFAWIAALSVLLLSIVYILRKMSFNNKEGTLFKWNQKLRKYHKEIGMIAIFSSVVHGFYSSFKIISWNKGTFAWLLIILLGLGYMVRKNLKGTWAKSHRLMALMVWILLVLHIFEVGGFVGTNALVYSLQKDGYIQTTGVEENYEVLTVTQEETTDIIEDNKEETPWDGLVLRDGIYMGQADAYGPDLITRVTIEKGLVSSIEIVSHNEVKEQYWRSPVEVLPNMIVEQETLAVDTISGATLTSYGILMSVQNALEEAIISGTSEVITMPYLRRRRGGH